eukprot:scaffold1206_cov388-Prasinococcus_capsulatus_cf.AAC.49
MSKGTDSFGEAGSMADGNHTPGNRRSDGREREVPRVYAMDIYSLPLAHVTAGITGAHSYAIIAAKGSGWLSPVA